MRKYYLVNCTVCGKEMKIRSDYIDKHSGVCLSCQKKGNKNAHKHGAYKTRLYRIWQGMFFRRYKTYNPTVCDEWKDFKVFEKWAYENGYNESLTIDRIDNKGNYEPNNCQWITLEENAGKDKLLLNDDECVELYNTRKILNLTQNEMAIQLGVSRNTVQRAEKRVKEMLVNER